MLIRRSNAHVLIITALLCSTCLTFASPALTCDIDANHDRIVIVGEPMDDTTGPEWMVIEFERIHSTREYYESKTIEVLIEDPSIGIDDPHLKKMASDLKRMIGIDIFTHGHKGELREVHPDNRMPADHDFIRRAAIMIGPVDVDPERLLENIGMSMMSLYMDAEDTMMINMGPPGSDRREDDPDDETRQNDVVSEDEGFVPTVPVSPGHLIHKEHTTSSINHRPIPTSFVFRIGI